MLNVLSWRVSLALDLINVLLECLNRLPANFAIRLPELAKTSQVDSGFSLLVVDDGVEVEESDLT